MPRPEITFDEKRHRYTVNGRDVPSVTTVLGIFDKPGVPGWAANVTTEGIARLIVERRMPTVANLQRVLRAEISTTRSRYMQDKMRDALAALEDSPNDEAIIAFALSLAIKRRLQAGRLDHRATLAEAADRGTAVHRALEGWIKDRRIPMLTEYPEHQRGYIQALTRFLVESDATFVESERFVASAVHGYAGTRDTVCILEHCRERVLLDLKTSKEVWWETQFPQLAAYELAGVECGEPPTDRQGIVRVGGDGGYEVRWSPDTKAAEGLFLALLTAWKEREALSDAVNA